MRCRLTLIVLEDVAQMVSAGVVRLAHAHRVVREVHIAIVTWISGSDDQYQCEVEDGGGGENVHREVLTRGETYRRVL